MPPNAPTDSPPSGAKRANPAIVTRGRFLSVAEVYFCDSVPELLVDRLYLMQAPRPLPYGHTTAFHTLVVDLEQDARTLRRRLRKGCQYKVRRAQRADGVVYETVDQPDEAALERFRVVYDRFARTRGLPPVRPAWLLAGAASGALQFSYITDEHGRDLVCHSYYRGSHRVRLLHSASVVVARTDTAFRNLVGRANRYLHWRDMLHFKLDGFSTYDMGGWYPGTDDAKKLGINAFKEEFGGEIVCEFNCDLVLTAKGRVITRLAGRLRA